MTILEARAARIALALNACAHLSEREAEHAADALDFAASRILRGVCPMLAVREYTVGRWPSQDSDTVEAAIYAVLNALTGSLDVLDGLARDRKDRVLRCALAVLAQRAPRQAAWCPEAVAIGPAAWNEVAAVARGASKAA